MPIIHVIDTPALFVMVQCAHCGLVQSVPAGRLVLGSEADLNAICVPACECGSQETLARTFDVAPEVLADHRKKVNALAIALKAAGQVHPVWASRVRAEKVSPAQVGELVGPVDAPHGMPDLVLPTGMKLPS